MSLSPERNGRLTASNFAAAMGLNPYQSRQKLYRQLIGIDPKFEGNEMTEYGSLHEPDAVDAYEAETGTIVEAANDKQMFIIHPEHNWLGCTPDGFVNDINDTLVEFKCPYKQELYVNVPAYYLPQVQGQMMITGAAYCHFVCWTPDELAVWGVESRQDYQEEMLELLTEFWQSVKSGEEPRRKKKPLLPAISIERII
ncbi:MAG: YqaJ viral recombinase family protein [Gammaproteobacteria bacterium]|nr:YqaJ viral recombinase family protein [Gammaproteobacteria bacterium]